MPSNFPRTPGRKSYEDLFRERLQNRVAPNGLVVTNREGPRASIRIYDEIGWFGITAEDFAAELESITADELEVQINSLGGDVFDGIAIYNALRAHPAKVTTRVDSMAASIASVIAQAGDERVMLSGSQMMIHEAWGFAIGNASEMRSLADILDKQSRIIAGIYAERADGEVDGFLEQMVSESWFDADEAVDAGLADQVVKPERRPDARSNGSLAQHIAAVTKAANDVSERVAEVAALRAEQGKPVDDTWQTRPDVDELTASLDRLVAALRPDDDEGPEATESQRTDITERLDALRARAEARMSELREQSERLEHLR